MSQATLIATAPDRFALSGELSFATVTSLLAQSRSLFAAVTSLDIDLSGVKHADSAGLSLLLAWLRFGKREGKAIRYRGLPAQLRALATISEVDSLFGNLA